VGQSQRVAIERHSQEHKRQRILFFCFPVVAKTLRSSRKQGDCMEKTFFCGLIWFFAAYTGFGQTAQESLCPKHIETPAYPAIARVAHVSGKVILALTIDANGNVSEANVTNEDDKGVKFLELNAMANVRLWTFAIPPSAPFRDTIVYDFEIDDALPGDDGNHPITKVTYDLPGRVLISANATFIDHGGNPNKKKHWW
jgi:TonB family protein